VQLTGWQVLTERHAVLLQHLLDKLHGRDPMPCSFVGLEAGTFATVLTWWSVTDIPVLFKGGPRQLKLLVR
jgi:hypothetical protein